MDVGVCNVDGARGYRLSHSLWLVVVVVVVGKESEMLIFFQYGKQKQINAPFFPGKKNVGEENTTRGEEKAH